MRPSGGTRAGFSIVLPNGIEADVERNTVSTSFFATLGVRLLEGRIFTEADDSSASKVAVVNRAFRQSFPDAGVGSFVQIRDQSWEVVGAVEDVQYHGSAEPIAPLVYLHEPQTPGTTYFQSLVVAVPRGREQQVAAELRRLIQQRFPDMVPPSLEPLRDAVSEQMWAQRVASRVALGVGVVELMLATAGLYGLLLFVLSARTREMGVRLALGARPLEATWAVLRNGLRYVILGGAAGLLLGVPVVKVSGLVLYDGVALPELLANGPTPFLGAAAAVLLAGAAASLVPALRATRVQPAAVLRDE
jgi:predicted lysophospholipase L1 biosynthesis ABC-type transport system permease subunit